MNKIRKNFNAKMYQLLYEDDRPLPPDIAPLSRYGWINGELFLNALTSGKTLQTVLEQASRDHISVCFEARGDVYVPIDWLRKRFPLFMDLYRLMSEQAEKSRYDNNHSEKDKS
jgi:hypothetical protein